MIIRIIAYSILNGEIRFDYLDLLEDIFTLIPDKLPAVPEPVLIEG